MALGLGLSAALSSSLTPAPVADFTGTPLRGIAPLDVAMTNASTGTGNTYVWDKDNDGGSDSTAENPTITFSADGTYSPKLTATNTGGSDSKTRSGYVVVGPTWTLSASDGTFTRSTTAGYYNSSGVWSSAAVDAKRYDYDPITLAAKGWLIEGARTNMLSQPLAIDNAAWTKSQCTVTADQAAWIDGTTTLEKVVETTNNNYHVALQAVSLTSGAVVAFSMFAKPLNQNYCAMNATARFAVNPVVNFTLTGAGSTNQTAGSTTNRISQHAQGLYRCSMVATPNSTGSSNARFYTANSATVDPTYAGDITKGLYYGGMQVELAPEGAFASSFYDGARGADSWTIATSAITEFSATAGTLIITGRTPGLGTRPLFSLDDGTSANRIEVYTSGTSLKMTVTASSVTQADITIGTITGYTEFKCAVTWSANAFRGSLAGAAAVSDTSGSVPTGLTTARVGSNQAGDIAFGHILPVSYIPVAASAAQCATLSA